VVGIETNYSVGELLEQLRAIEDANGRARNGPKFSSRTLDIDILTYDQVVGVVDGVELPRDELSKNAFVLLPMVDVAPAALHPELGQSYSELWQAYDQSSQKLWSVDFNWQGRAISRAS
jgi:2-amino-4-hydroxy-6-hydroxymethyldihydropteridine diphosphokinase